MRLESKLNVIKEYSNRFPFFVGAVVVVFCILAFRLAYLQLSHGGRYVNLSEDNFIQERVLLPLRGQIKDVEGRTLASNRPAYNVHVTPAFVKNLEDTLLRLEGYLNLSSEEIGNLQHQFETIRGLRRFRELLVKTDISRPQLAVLESHKLDLPGVSVRPGPRREYPETYLTSNIVGYVSRINTREKKKTS